MTQDDKQLLLKDLCARLPYGVIVHYKNKEGESGDVVLGTGNIGYVKELGGWWKGCKPYLRPMSSMTEEEKEKLKSLYDAENVTNESICFLEGGTLEEYEAEISFVFCYCVVEWLLENHFDFMGLIPKGLAIAVTEQNNPYK